MLDQQINQILILQSLIIHFVFLAGGVLQRAPTPVHLEAAAGMGGELSSRRGDGSKDPRPSQTATPSQTQTAPGRPEETEDLHGQNRYRGLSAELQTRRFTTFSLYSTQVNSSNLPFYFPESSALYVVSNAATIGLSEVELTQLVVDGVKLLIAMEKRLEVDRDIDELVPTQK